MDIINEALAVIQPVQPEWYHKKIRQLDVLRLDRIHPEISGNKWYKLKRNLQAAADGKAKSVLSFGGHFSNHLLATAAAANAFNIPSIGIVRGHNNSGELTQTLAVCQDLGMDLHFVSKENYARREDPEYLAYLSKKFDKPFIISEGGANKEGRVGAEAIGNLIPDSYTHIAVSVGTGTTLAGLRSRLPMEQAILGFSPMKKGRYLMNDISALLPEKKNGNWELYDDWHFGGFGKWNGELIGFMNDFYKVNDIPLDMVYTAKMMAGIGEQVKEGFFPAAAKILCIHTGGLQGNTSLRDKLIY